MADCDLLVVDTDTGRTIGEAELKDQDVVFPPGVDGWTDVLDARHPPYTSQSLDETCHEAAHVRKPYLLVRADDVDADDE
ncbi:MAG: hypothetical protein ABEL76_12635 [Bradymonadaceae bacterium]